MDKRKYFGTDGIRGRVGEHPVSADFVLRLGAAAGRVLAGEGKPLSELVAPLRRYAASGEINRRVADLPGLLRAVERDHADAPEISHLDGLLVRYPHWWFNLRPSNTEPVVRLNLEADTRDAMVERRDALLGRIDAWAAQHPPA